MKIFAIVAEYNPLHKGHIHHIKTVKKIADAVVEAKEGNLATADDEESETMQELVEKEGIDKIERKPKQNNRRNYTRRNDKKEEATEEVKAEEVAEETETTEE